MNKNIVYYVNIISSIILFSLLNKVLDNFLVSLFIAASVELIIIDMYFISVSNKLSKKSAICLIIGVIGLFISLVIEFPVLESIMAMLLITIQLILFIYIILHREK